MTVVRARRYDDPAAFGAQAADINGPSLRNDVGVYPGTSWGLYS